MDYREGEAKDRYDKTRALVPVLVLGFIQATQEKMWRSLEAIHGAETGKVVLFLNGLPIATAELKNRLSGQTVKDARKRYKKERDYRELLFDFTKRTLVHFAVDQDLVFMTTRLSGDKTHFLPFNLGNQGHAGNSPAADGGYRTA